MRLADGDLEGEVPVDADEGEGSSGDRLNDKLAGEDRGCRLVRAKEIVGEAGGAVDVSGDGGGFEGEGGGAVPEGSVPIVEWPRRRGLHHCIIARLR